MAQLSITTAWNETTAFLSREARLVFPVAFLLVALPGLALQLAGPASAPGEMPQIGVLWLVLLPVTIAAGIIGSIAIAFLALRPGTSVGEALQRGLRRFIPLFLASLLIGIAAMIVIIPLVMLVVGGSALSGGDLSEGDLAALAGPLVLLALILLVLGVALWVKLMLMTPVAAAEDDAGPIRIIARSWTLTAGHFWKLLGFVLLLFIAIIVTTIVISMIAGILIALFAGPPEPNSLSFVLLGIVSAVVQAIISAVVVTLTARVYVQLSGRSDQVGDVFT
jgi:uncharacterized membrane protein